MLHHCHHQSLPYWGHAQANSNWVSHLPIIIMIQIITHICKPFSSTAEVSVSSTMKLLLQPPLHQSRFNGCFSGEPTLASCATGALPPPGSEVNLRGQLVQARSLTSLNQQCRSTEGSTTITATPSLKHHRLHLPSFCTYTSASEWFVIQYKTTKLPLG